MWMCQCVCGNILMVRSCAMLNGHTRSCGCYNKKRVKEANIKDLSGLRYGYLLVLGHTKDKSGFRWECQCDCGNTTYVRTDSLHSGTTKSCGCLNRLNIKIGTIFGRLTVISNTDKLTKHGKTLWLCVCSCGEKVEVTGSNLIKGTSRSCGCSRKDTIRQMRVKDLTNQRFGRLTVLFVVYSSSGKRVSWRCVCDCGRETTVSSTSLVSGNTQSCGCLLCKGSIYIYALISTSNRLIKIGISGNAVRRRKTLEEHIKDSLGLLAYRLSSRSEETEIHDHLKPYRAVHPNQPRGKEWFHPTPEVMSVVDSIIKGEVQCQP